MKRKLLHISSRKSRCLEPNVFRSELGKFGDLTVIEHASDLSPDQIADQVRRCNIYLAGWDSVPLPSSLASDRGKLEYVCGITGSMKEYVPVDLVQAGIPLTNWGDVPSAPVAEGALGLLLASIKDLHHHIRVIREGGWWITPEGHGGFLQGLHVGVYGCGVIGRRFAEMLRVFGCVIRVYDPYITEMPAGIERVRTLEELFSRSQAIVIHAALTPETRKSVTAELLALLPDSGIVVNTARGDILDQDALFAELETGRLRAALDVLEGSDLLSLDHPARKWDNLILTSHQIEMGWPKSRERLERMHEVCLDNIRRWTTGEPLRFVMDPVRYQRST